MGDINVDVKNADLINKTGKHIIELHDPQQLITVPRRVTAHSEIIIDHLYTLDLDKVAEVFELSCSIGDTCIRQQTVKIEYH